MSVVIRTTPEADAQALRVAEWWRTNRPAAADLFAEELAGAFDLLARAPDIGRRYRRVGIPGLRRVLLPATRYHVYYVHSRDEATCIVLAIWGATRGRPLRLRPSRS
jgi:plasmid stabilization system protein ParE